MRAFLEAISSMTHSANITKPVFIVAGNDPRVPYTEGPQMTAAIGAAWPGISWRPWVATASPKREGNRQFAATVMFIRKYLLE